MTRLGRSGELVSRCVECDLAEPESLASLGGSAPGVVDGILSHMIGSVEHVFNKKLIIGNVRKANGAHMKMLCEGDINVDVITKNVDVTSGTLRVKVIPGMKQKLFSFTQAMIGGWTMQGGQTKQGELFIALTHEDHKPIIFDRVLKAGNSVLLAAKMVIKNPEEVNAAIINGKQSKEYFHRVTGHAGHHLMDAVWGLEYTSNSSRLAPLWEPN